MITRKSFIDVMLVYLLLFVSGTLLYKQSPEIFLLVAFLFSVIAWALFSDRKINDGFILYVCIFAGFLLTIHFYTDGSLSIASVVGTTMKLVMAYLIMKTVGESFTDAYIKVIVVLAGFSLFGFMTDQLHLFDNVIRKLPRLGDNGYEGILYVYRYRYAGYDRNNSIFFEPGAYQAFLNAALFMLLFVKTEFSTSRRWIYILLLSTALYTTYSTTGFLIFAVMFGLFLFKSDVLSASGKAVLVGMLLVMTAIFSAQFNTVIIEKIDRYLSIQDITDNDTHKRSFDLVVDLEIIKKHAFGVGYKKYFEVFSSIGLVGEGQTSSNGVTKTMAVFGIPFSLFLFISYYWAFRRLLGSLFLSIVTFGMFLMFLVGEAYYVFSPSCLVIIAAAFVYGRLTEFEASEPESEVAA